MIFSCGAIFKGKYEGKITKKNKVEMEMRTEKRISNTE